MHIMKHKQFKLFKDLSEEELEEDHVPVEEGELDVEPDEEDVVDDEEYISDPET